MPRNQVFISYSPQDQKWLDRLRTMLTPLIHNQVISVWDDTQIEAGTQREAQIQNALTAANVAVLMVSPHFLASDFIANHELPRLLQAAELEELTILWVYVRPCFYDLTEVNSYQAAHDISQPLKSLSEPECDQVLKSICQRIERAANQPPVIPPVQQLMQAIENAARPIVWSRIKNVILFISLAIGILAIGIPLSISLIKYLIPVPEILPSSPPPLSVSPSTSPSPSLLVDACNNTPDFISCGEKSDFTNYASDEDEPELTEKQSGMQEFAKANYKEAVKNLKLAWEKEKDPSTLIALNNASVMSDLKDGKISNDKVFTIAISSGFKKTPKEIGGSILTGVAWRQTEVNNQNQYSFRLIVVMADDKNLPKQAVDVARELVKRKEILGVIGSYSSKATYYVIDEYRKGKLVLVSATSTATKEAYISEKKDTNWDFSWFFRTVSTTKIGAERLVEYLEKEGYKKVKIFYQAGDLFGKSFYIDFTNKLKPSNLKIIQPSIQYVSTEQIEQEITKLKHDYNQDITALAILADAYTNRDTRYRKLHIIENNNGEFFVVGNNTLFDPRLLTSTTISKKSLEKMVIAVPWYPSSEDRKELADFVKIETDKNPYNFWSVDEPQLTWHMAMSYDAIQMLVQAISQQLSKGQTPTREGIRSILANPTFKTKGLTGTITLEKSDRKEQFYSLIRPDCSTNPCGWLEIDKYPSRK